MKEFQSYLDKIAAVVGEGVGLFRIHTTDPNKYVPIDPQNYMPGFKFVGNHSDPYYVVRTVGGKNVMFFKIVCFPGCCALCISTGTTIPQSFPNPEDPYGHLPGYRRKGLNHIGLALRQAIAWVSGYTALVCTDVDKNIPQRKTLTKAGFVDVLQVKNRRTMNVVNLSVKLLEKTKE